jgi:hypothetical protein
MKYILATLFALCAIATQMHAMQLFKQGANKVLTHNISIQKLHTTPSSQSTTSRSCPIASFLSGCSLILSGYAFHTANETKMLTYQALQDVRFKSFVLTSKDGGANALDK